MSGLRLRPSVAVLTTEGGALLRSDLRTLELSGRDASVVVAHLVPLLDGTRARSELAAALDGYSQASVFALLDTLGEYGMLEEADERNDPAYGLQQEFLSRVAMDPGEAWRRLREGGVGIVGLEPWGVAAALQLARSGLAKITLVDDRPPSEYDIGLRALPTGGSGSPRSDVLARQIERMLPDCDPRTGRLDELATVISDDLDLVVVATSIDDTRVLNDVANATHKLGVPSLHAHVEGLDAVLGPFVVPGETACWNCYRLRRLGNADDPGSAYKVQRGVEGATFTPRAHPHLLPMPDLLGNLLALESLKIISHYNQSQLAGRVLVQNLVTLVTSVHSVVRLPWCEVCGGASVRRTGTPGGSESPLLPSDDEEDGQPPLAAIEDPDELRARLEGWVDERTGVIRLLTVNHPEPPDPELPFASTAVVSAYTDGVHYEAWSGLASGKGLTRTAAMLGAAGEAIERYSASRYRRSDLFRGRLADVPGDRIDPRDLCLYDDSQYRREGFPFARFRENRALDWANATWLDNGEPVMVPALLAYFNFGCSPEERFAEVNSNGLAAGADEEDAAIRATFELIERDSFMLTWLARVPGQRLIPDAIDDQLGEAVRQLEIAGGHIELALLGAGARIPTIACLAFGDGRGWPGMTLALATHADPLTAVRKAILEQGHVGPYIRRLMRDGTHRGIDKPGDVRTLEDHALYYVRAERRARAEFMFAGGEVKLSELAVPASDLRASCVQALEEEGVRVAIVDVTSPDVAQGPFRVARAIGTDMQPIHFGHGLERLANPRLKRIAPNGVNPDPHPLA
jgi:ribosomal protein S12 methylthiotransferase accessory factor